MTATQTPLRREPCSTHRRRISIGDARSWRGINDGSFLPQAIRKVATAIYAMASKFNIDSRTIVTPR